MGGGRGQTPKYSSTILQSFSWYFPSFSPPHPAHPHTPNPFTPRKNNHISLLHELGGGGEKEKGGNRSKGIADDNMATVLLFSQSSPEAHMEMLRIHFEAEYICNARQRPTYTVVTL